MNKALLAVVCAASMGSYAMAATPIDLTAQIPSGDVVETLQNFNVKFLLNDQNWVSMSEGNVAVNPENKIVVTGNGETYESETVLVVYGSIINVRLKQMIRRPGTYQIEIPEGLVSYDGKCNKAITISVTVTGSTVGMSQSEWMQYFVMNPRDGESLTSLSTFTLAGTTKLEISLSQDAILTAPDGTRYQSGADLLADDTQAQYRFSAPADTPGSYVLTIPENSLKATLNGVATANPELVFHYTVKSAQSSATPVDVDLAVSPLNATTSADSFTSFFVKVTDGEDILGPFTIDSDLLDKVTVQSATTSYRPSAIINVDNDPSAIELKFATPITAGGTYSITLPEGLLSWEKFTNETLTLENAFTCTGEVVDYFGNLKWYQGSWEYKTAVPENFEVETLYRVFGLFDNIPEDIALNIATEGDGEDVIGTSRATVELPSGETYSRIISPVTKDNHAFSVSFSLDGAYRAEGDYTLTIPAGSFNVNGNNNPEIKQVFKIVDKNTYTPVDFGLNSIPKPDVTLDKLTYISWTFKIIDDDNKEIYNVIGVKPNSKITVTPKGGTPFEVAVEEYNTMYNLAGFAIDLVPDITQSGEYTVSIPEGVYRVSNATTGALLCNAAATYTYIVKNDNPGTSTVLPSVSPAPGNVASLSTIEFVRPTAHTLYLPEPVVPFTLTLPSGENVEVIPTTNPNVEGDYVFVNLPQTYTEVGEYTLSVPANGLQIFNSAEQAVAFPAQKYVYNVIAFTPTDLAYTADPANGSSIYEANYVYVKFDDKVTYTKGVKVSLTTPENETSEVITSFNEANNRLLLTFGYLDPSLYGEYTFTVPEGIVVTADGRTNKEFKLKYNYIERAIEKIDFIVTPTQGIVDSFRKVVITAPAEFTSIERMDYDNTKLEISIEKSGNDEPEKKNLYVKADDNDARTVYVELEEALNTSNKYDITLTLPESIFILKKEDGSQVLNASARLSWRLDKDGVMQLFGDEDSVTVYTIDGRCIYRNVETSALETLEDGIYVINGKKVNLKN